MDILLLPGSPLHKCLCPICLKDFNVDERKPFVKANECGHVICNVCMDYERQFRRPCPLCPMPRPYNHANFWMTHSEMILNLPAYHQLTSDYEDLYRHYEMCQRKNFEAKQKLALISGSKLMGFPYPYSKKWCRPNQEETMKQREGKWQPIDLLHAIQNMLFDKEVLTELCQHCVDETDAFNQIYRTFEALPDAEGPYNPAETVSITRIPERHEIVPWIHKVLEHMNFGIVLIRRHRILVDFPHQTLKIEFHSEVARNLFVQGFDAAVTPLYPKPQNRPLISTD